MISVRRKTFCLSELDRASWDTLVEDEEIPQVTCELSQVLHKRGQVL